MGYDYSAEGKKNLAKKVFRTASAVRENLIRSFPTTSEAYISGREHFPFLFPEMEYIVGTAGTGYQEKPNGLIDLAEKLSEQENPEVIDIYNLLVMARETWLVWQYSQAKPFPDPEEYLISSSTEKED